MIDNAKDKLEKIKVVAMDLYTEHCDSTPPELFGALLGIHELAELALKDLEE
ncbi:unnamed protein product [marine sediment metagenome]|uniref:NTP pyrophosphohydrolase MazG putative catalytic core domain-containing protein n=1 Tax=marine sediment metagenome TaxID=412755 RepID=X0Y1V1_9ZZZZ